MQNVIKNAILTLSGSVNNIGVTAYKDNQGITIQTLVKHNPASTWYGIKPTDGYISYYNVTLGSSSASTLTYRSKTQANYYATAGFTSPCGTTTDLVVPNQQNTAASWPSSSIDFNFIGATPSFSTQPITHSNSGTAYCGSAQLTATVNTPYNFSVSIYDPTDDLLGTGTNTPTFTVNIDTTVTGEYRAVLTLSTGCVIETIYTLDEVI